MSMLQNDMFNEQVAESKAESDGLAKDRILEDLRSTMACTVIALRKGYTASSWIFAEEIIALMKEYIGEENTNSKKEG